MAKAVAQSVIITPNLTPLVLFALETIGKCAIS